MGVAARFPEPEIFEECGNEEVDCAIKEEDGGKGEVGCAKQEDDGGNGEVGCAKKGDGCASS